MKTIALDIDLCRIHAWSDLDGKVCYNADEPPWGEMASHDKILVEVASPRLGSGRAMKKGEQRNRMSWAIYNLAITGEIANFLDERSLLQKLFVSPSDIWTRSYPEAVRAEMAGVTGKDNHDLRECQAMLFFHKLDNKLWVPYREYLSSLSKAKS